MYLYGPLHRHAVFIINHGILLLFPCMSKPSFFFQPHILPHHTHHHIKSPTSTSLSPPIPLQTTTVALPCLASHMQKIDCWQPFGDATKDVPRAPPFVKKSVHHCEYPLPAVNRKIGECDKYQGIKQWLRYLERLLRSLESESKGGVGHLSVFHKYLSKSFEASSLSFRIVQKLTCIQPFRPL